MDALMRKLQKGLEVLVMCDSRATCENLTNLLLAKFTTAFAGALAAAGS